MNVRIIAGKFGGRIISAPDGEVTHPMSERVRGSLFNIVGDEVKNAEVLDAFAGSGSLGFEALSRGAKHVIFIDKDRLACEVLKKNISDLELSAKTAVLQMEVGNWISKNSDKIFDVIFTDAPYNDTQFSTVSRLSQLLRPNALMVLSYPGRGEVPPVDGFVVVDNRSYGTAALAFYRKK